MSYPELPPPLVLKTYDVPVGAVLSQSTKNTCSAVLVLNL